MNDPYCIHLGDYFDLPEGHKWEEVELELSLDFEDAISASWSGCRSNTRESREAIVSGDKIWVLGSADDIDLDDLLSLGKEFLNEPWDNVGDMLMDFSEQLDN